MKREYSRGDMHQSTITRHFRADEIVLANGVEVGVIGTVEYTDDFNVDGVRYDAYAAYTNDRKDDHTLKSEEIAELKELVKEALETFEERELNAEIILPMLDATAAVV